MPPAGSSPTISEPGGPVESPRSTPLGLLVGLLILGAGVPCPAQTVIRDSTPPPGRRPAPPPPGARHGPRPRRLVGSAGSTARQRPQARGGRARAPASAS